MDRLAKFRRRRLFLTVGLGLVATAPLHRSIWVRPRMSDIFQDTRNWSPGEWYANIRMSQVSFL